MVGRQPRRLLYRSGRTGCNKGDATFLPRAFASQKEAHLVPRTPAHARTEGHGRASRDRPTSHGLDIVEICCSRRCSLRSPGIGGAGLQPNLDPAETSAADVATLTEAP